jgi:hypothetical protein
MRPLTFYVEPELYDAFRAAAKARGMTSDIMGTKAITLALEESCEPIPPSVRLRLAKYERNM